MNTRDEARGSVAAPARPPDQVSSVDESLGNGPAETTIDSGDDHAPLFHIRDHTSAWTSVFSEGVEDVESGGTAGRQCCDDRSRYGSEYGDDRDPNARDRQGVEALIFE